MGDFKIIPEKGVVVHHESFLHLYLDLLTVVGKSTTYSPTWWFNGDLPW